MLKTINFYFLLGGNASGFEGRKEEDPHTEDSRKAPGLFNWSTIRQDEPFFQVSDEDDENGMERGNDLITFYKDGLLSNAHQYFSCELENWGHGD